MPGFVTNLTNRATTQILDLDFDSFCEAWGNPLAAGESGIYDLCCDDESEETISAYFETPVINLGNFEDKRLRFVYIGFEADSELTVSVSVDGSDYRDYLVIPKKTGRQRVRIPVEKKEHGCYWQFKISNRKGVFFAIDHLSTLIVNTSETVG